MEASDVQPTQGQGAEGDSGLYDLNEVPQEQRELLEPHLKAIEGNVTRKFQEHADYRNKWQPFEELGLLDSDPEALGNLLEWARMAESDPQGFAEWFEQVGNEVGLFDQLGYSKGEADLMDGLDDDSSLSEDDIANVIREVLAEEMAPLQEQMTQQQQDQLVQEAEGEIVDQLGQIHEQNPDLPEGADEAILQLAYTHAEDGEEDPIGLGLADYQKIIGAGEGNLFAQKAGQPRSPEGPGAADTSAEQITSFGDKRLKAAAMERLQRAT